MTTIEREPVGRPDSKRAHKQLVFMGTYDRWRNRNRVLISGLRARGWHVTELNRPVFSGTDRGSLRGRDLFRLASLHFWQWLKLGLAYFRLPPHQAVLVGHLGSVDAPFAGLLARLRGVPLIADLSVPVHEAALSRGLVRPGSPLADLLSFLDRLSFRLCRRALCDTRVHMRALSREMRLPNGRWLVVPVGCSPIKAEEGEELEILFYGHYHPLQGAAVVVKAAAFLKDFRFSCIGDGSRRDACERIAGSNVHFEPVLPYDRLMKRVSRALVVLGIFGKNRKARLVVPNKVFEGLAAGRAVVTADTPAIRELLRPGDAILVPPGDPVALARALREVISKPAIRSKLQRGAQRAWSDRFQPYHVVEDLDRCLHGDSIFPPKDARRGGRR